MKIIKLLAIMGIFKIATKGASEKQYLKSHFFSQQHEWFTNSTFSTTPIILLCIDLEIYVENVPETITQC